MEKQNNNFGIAFYLFCPANPTIFDEPMIMFHNGSMKDNLNFKSICPLKQKEQTARISYENNYDIYVYQSINQLEMEGNRWGSIREALLGVGVYSQICHHWEIYKLLFLLHNVNPDWIEVDKIAENINKVFIIYFSSNPLWENH